MNSTQYLILFLFPLFGGLASQWVKGKSFDRNLKLMLAFSGAFLFSITILGLIPEFYNKADDIGYFVLIGFFFQIVLEFFSKGVEHGHLHHHGKKKGFPFAVFVALGLHAFLEGLPIGAESFSDEHLHGGLLWGVALHEVPAAFALGTILSSGQRKLRRKVLPWIIVYALMSPIGAFLGTHLVELNIDEKTISRIMAIVIGTFLHISTTILFENSDNHKIGKMKLAAILIGVSLALIALH